MSYPILRLIDHPEMKQKMALWFHQKWGIPLEAYEESMEDALQEGAIVPSWYVAMDGECIIGGLGVIENDFHDRPDLSPNVCAVYTEPEYRKKGIAGSLLGYVSRDMRARGIDTLYLLTDHDAFYERYGWKFHTWAMGEGEEKPSRLYIYKEET